MRKLSIFLLALIAITLALIVVSCIPPPKTEKTHYAYQIYHAITVTQDINVDSGRCSVETHLYAQDRLRLYELNYGKDTQVDSLKYEQSKKINKKIDEILNESP